MVQPVLKILSNESMPAKWIQFEYHCTTALKSDVNHDLPRGKFESFDSNVVVSLR